MFSHLVQSMFLLWLMSSLVLDDATNDVLLSSKIGLKHGIVAPHFVINTVNLKSSQQMYESGELEAVTWHKIHNRHVHHSTNESVIWAL